MKVAVTRRPIVIETRTSAAILQETLARMETIKGRASAWGILNNAELAALWAGDSIEADFTRSYYRDGFVESSAPAFLPGYAFSRTGAGTARDTLGRIQSFATGEPRITDLGALIEPGSTNMALRSNDLGAAPWFGSNASGASGYAIAPDGTNTAARIEATGASALWLQTFAASEPSGVYSVFVKKGSGATQANQFMVRDYTSGTNPVACSVNYDTGAVTYLAGTGPAAMERYADGWWRLDLPVIAGVTPAGEVGIFVGFIFTDGAIGQWCQAWGAQFEHGRSAPTSLIPTTSASATRGEDLLTLSGALSPAGGTVLAEFRRGRPRGTEETVIGDNDGDALLIMANDLAYSYVDHVGLAAGTPPAAFQISKAALTWGPGERRVVFGSTPSTADGVGGPTGNQLQVGSQTGAWRLGGYIRRLLVTAQRATESQLEAMTA